MAEALIVDTCRTPRGIGKVGKGALAHLHPQHLAATVLSAIAERNDLNTEDISDVIWGTATQQGKQGLDLGRMAALLAGYSTRASGVTLDRFCGAGITTVSMAAAQIMSGMEDLVVAGGTEMMSYTASIADTEKVLFMDADNPKLRALHPQSHQGVCADAIASLEGISRQALDEFACESQKRAAKAIAENRFEKSIVPVRNDDGTIALDTDEYPRPSTNFEALSGLKPSFGAVADYPLTKEGLTFRKLINARYEDLDFEPKHHAGNSSGVVDGAAAVLLASEDYVKKNNLKPRARVLATANMGDCPTLMLNAPVPAARLVLRKAGLSVNDIDVWEINEAFAVVAEKFVRDLSLDREKVNTNGGAIALGHPIGATGSILIGTALDELERTDSRYGLITMCAAGGMAPAIVIERI
ncbi:MAG: acetyl-CoA C-acetyltransferase [Pseudomonadota bacterium]